MGITSNITEDKQKSQLIDYSRMKHIYVYEIQCVKDSFHKMLCSIHPNLRSLRSLTNLIEDNNRIKRLQKLKELDFNHSVKEKQFLYDNENEDITGRLIHLHEPDGYTLDLILNYYGLLKIKRHITEDFGYDIVDYYIQPEEEANVKITRFIVPFTDETTNDIQLFRMTLVTKVFHYSKSASRFQSIDLVFTQRIDLNSQPGQHVPAPKLDFQNEFFKFLNREVFYLMCVYPIRPSITFYSACLKYLMVSTKKLLFCSDFQTQIRSNNFNSYISDRLLSNLESHLYSEWYLQQDKIVKRNGTVLNFSWGSQIITYIDQAKKSNHIKTIIETLESERKNKETDTLALKCFNFSPNSQEGIPEKCNILKNIIVSLLLLFVVFSVGKSIIQIIQIRDLCLV